MKNSIISFRSGHLERSEGQSLVKTKKRKAMKLLTARQFDQRIAFLHRLLQLEEPLSD